MKNQLTEKQKDILNFIIQFHNEVGYPPTLRQIGKHFGISSTFGVKRHLDALVKKGYLNVESFASRGISIIKQENETSRYYQDNVFPQIPIIGRVAAGIPITAIENIEGSVAIDPSLFKHSENCFALKVKGDSMINAGIFDGDLVIVSQTNEVKNNDIVVAIIDEEATVKRFYNTNNQIKLIPENENYQPIEITNYESFSIAGKVIGAIKLFN
ncbi:MAG: transcriptional repressor LexA [Ignavibacterium sp.]